MIVLLGCAPDEATVPSVFVPLDDARLARRISIDLRGELPTLEELETAESGGLDGLVEEWMADPRFEAHLVDVFAEDWQLRADTLRVGPEEFGFSHEADAFAWTRTVADEPAHLMAHVAAADVPWTDIVTTDTTIANDMLAEMVSLEFTDPTDDGEWREARYTDGRPAGGVLMTSGLWLRFPTTIFNYNRGRAAAMSRLLLCHDLASRPVAFTDTADNTSEGQWIAITTVDGCIACHATLDPLAATLFGFWPFEDKDGAELVTYHPERERYAVQATGNPPGYFGTPVTSAAQLGLLVAADPRFEMCSVRRTAGRLWGREPADADLPELVGLRDQFRAGDLRYKALVRATIESPEYRAGHLDGATDAELELYRPLRTLSPNTLADVIEGLTTFRWRWQGWEELDSDHSGFRVLLGGADGDSVQTSALDPSLSRAMVIRRVAQAAAQVGVDHDLALPAAERLLLPEDADTLSAESAEFVASLTTIHRRLFAMPPTEAQLEVEQALYAEVYVTYDAHQAWTALISVLLRDPDFWTY